MADTFKLTILTPDKSFLTGQAEQIIFETPDGRIGIMAEHVPTVASVAEGILEIYMDGQMRTAAAGHGFAEIGGDGAEFFVDTVEWAEDIDTVRAKNALERAEQLMQSELNYVEFLRAQAAMSRALARLQAAKRIGYRDEFDR